MNYEEKTVIQIYTNKVGKKEVIFLGYGYNAEGSINDDDKTFRFLEYCGLIATLSEIQTEGFAKWENRESEFVKQLITDCTEDEMNKIYENYCAKEIAESAINEDTPDGVYIVIYKE